MSFLAYQDWASRFHEELMKEYKRRIVMKKPTRISQGKESRDHHSYQAEIKALQEESDAQMKRINQLLEEREGSRHTISYGHPQFDKFMDDLKKLHSEKNTGYASGGMPLGNFNRAAHIMENYPRFPVTTPIGVLMMYLLKHFDRIMYDLNRGLDPSDDSLRDIAVYVTIVRCILHDNNQLTTTQDMRPMSDPISKPGSNPKL